MLSIVIVTVYGAAYLERCLLALERQIQAPSGLDVIAVHNKDDDKIRLLQSRFSGVRFYHLPGRQSQNTLRSFGVKQATGKIVAITVDHCTAEERWCYRLLEAHSNPDAAIGGAIDMGSQPATLVNWAIHLYDYCNYGAYLRTSAERHTEDLSDCNVSYKRDALLATKEVWMKEFNVSLLNKALLRRGDTLRFSPQVVVRQNRNASLKRAARIAYDRGRAFASARLAASSDVQRIAHAMFLPGLPLLLLSRLVKNIYRNKKYYGIAFRALPLILILMLLWSWGEFLAQLVGKSSFTLALTEE